MILAPQEISPGIDIAAVRAEIASISTDHNTVVLVPSDRLAEEWRPYADRTVHADDMATTVGDLRSGEHVGLVVFVNKYDGVDLPDEACRVLVLDGLPEVATGEERLEAQLLRHAGIDDRQIQRIEQGMGRAVRSNEDHCVVFLLGSHLSQLVADPRTFSRFSPATQAQLELSRTVAAGLDNAPLADIMAVAKQALDRDESWVKLAKAAVSSIPAPVGAVSDIAVARREAFEAASDGDHRRAAELLSAAVVAASSEREEGWLLEQKAAYLDHLDPVGAQDVLSVARRKNPMALRPLSGVTYQRLSASGSQAQRAADYLRATYPSGTALRLGVQAIVDDLVAGGDRTNDFEEALRQVGDHLGFVGQRPEQELGAGPDVLWALGDMKYLVIEAKTGATSQVIHRRDVNQLTGSMNWFRERYDQSAVGTPVIVHPSRTLARDAAAPTGMRVIEMGDGLARLREALLAYASGLAGDRWDNQEVVDAQLRGHHLRAQDLVGYMRAARSSSP
jgi:hypothetical protein